MTASPRNAFDAIIIGAGVAGSAAAIQLAGAGWAVALVERQAFPRRKVCGECVAASNLPWLQVLGVGDAFNALAGAALRRVSLMHGDASVTAELPPAATERHAWGRALGRDTLDTLLLEQARAAGATVFQPWAVQAILGRPGAWHVELRAQASSAILRCRAPVVIDAHGSWEDLPVDRPRRRLARRAADLFAFKASYAGSSLPEGVIHVLALPGGYGGMVQADAGTMVLACCIRRDQLNGLRDAAPGLRASDAVEAWLQRECQGVQQALHGAVREHPWLSAGPLNPDVHLDTNDGIFRIGNAAGEAHPILGEGMSMALQSAALLCGVLLGTNGADPAEQQRRYARAWHRAFAPRLWWAAVFAHLAMRPRAAAAGMGLLRLWPGLLTQGARWGGKLSFASTSLTDGTSIGTAVLPATRGGLKVPPFPPREEST